MDELVKLKSKKIIREYLIVIGLILVILACLMQYQLIHRIWQLGDDNFFHDSRFYDTAQQILHHNFSYFQMNYGAMQSGRVINAIYGPFFAYLLGGLVLVAGSWFRFQILQNCFLFLVGGIGMYRLTRKLGAAKWASLLSMSMFLVTGFMAYWILGGTFNSWGAALMPYVLIQGLKMIQSKKAQINWISLGTIMAIVGQVHLLSVLFSGLALFPFFIYGFIVSDEKKNLICNLIKAVALFILLTINVWGAFLVLYSTNSMSTTYPFPLFENAIHFGPITVRNMITKVVVLLFALQVVYAVWSWKREKINLFITLEGAGFLLLSSQIVPWNKVQTAIPSLTSSLQFPNRLTVIAYPLLFAAIGYSLTSLFQAKGVYKILGVVGAGFALFTICLSTKQDINQNIERCRRNTLSVPNVLIWGRESKMQNLVYGYPSVNPEYLPLHIHKKVDSETINTILRKEFYGPKNISFHKRVLSKGRLQVEWTSSNTQEVLLPIIMYSQSELRINGQKKLVQHFNAIGMPYVQSKIGKNKAILSFKTPIWFTALLWITIISWIGIIITSIYKKKASD